MNVEKAQELCECGHLRMNHNNRMIKPFYPDLKYNCCLENLECGCTKFKRRDKHAQIKQKTMKGEKE